MASVRETWAAMSGRSRVGSVSVVSRAVASVVAIAGGGALARAAHSRQPTVDPEAGRSSRPPSRPGPACRRSRRRRRRTRSASPSPTPSPTPPGADPLLGTDGRLTVLLLGSDYRPAHPGNRTDAIMVVSVDPSTGRTAAFSIPRDTTGFPLPGGGRFDQKINALYQYFQSTGRRRRGGDGGGHLEGLRDRGRRLRVHRVQRGQEPGRRGRRRRRRPRPGLLRPVLLGHEPAPGLGPAGRQEPPQRRPGADLRPVAQGRQRLRPGAPPADPRRGRADQGPHARARGSCRSCSGSPATPSGPTCRWPGPATCSSLVSTVDLKHADKVVFGPRSYADGIAGTSSFVLRPRPTAGRWIAEHFPPVRPFGSLAAAIALADADGQPADPDADALTSISAARRSPARRARSRSCAAARRTPLAGPASEPPGDDEHHEDRQAADPQGMGPGHEQDQQRPGDQVDRVRSTGRDERPESLGQDPEEHEQDAGRPGPKFAHASPIRPGRRVAGGVLGALDDLRVDPVAEVRDVLAADERPEAAQPGQPQEVRLLGRDDPLERGQRPRLDEDDPVDRPAGREAELVARPPGRTPAGPGSRRTPTSATTTTASPSRTGMRRPASSQAISRTARQLGHQVAAGQQRP